MLEDRIQNVAPASDGEGSPGVCKGADVVDDDGVRRVVCQVQARCQRLHVPECLHVPAPRFVLLAATP